MKLDSYPLTPPQSPSQTPNLDYPTEPERTDDYPDKSKDRFIQRVNQTSASPDNSPELPKGSASVIPDETKKILDEPTKRPEEPTERSEDSAERSENTKEKTEESSEGPEKSTERTEEPTERSEEPTERPEEFTEGPEEHTETAEESKKIDKTDLYVPRIPDYTVELKESNKYDEVSYKRPENYIPPPPVEEFTSEPPYSTFKPPISNVPHRIPPNKTFTIRKQEFIKESKVYVDNSFQEVSSKFNGHLFYVYDIFN